MNTILNHVVLFLALCCFFVGFEAYAKTLADLVAKEEGVELGECLLSPKPKLAGEKTVIVIPARFEDSHYWVTHSILLIGVNKENLVQGELELKILQGLSPKEVISAVCDKNILTIRVSGKKQPKVLTYSWDGEKLREVTKIKSKTKK